jgi:hypothetical protein
LLALCALAVGGVAARISRSSAGAPGSSALAERKAALLVRGRQLHAQRDANEIGPEYYKEQKNALVEELSLLLHAEARRDGARAGARSS